MWAQRSRASVLNSFPHALTHEIYLSVYLSALTRRPPPFRPLCLASPPFSPSTKTHKHTRLCTIVTATRVMKRTRLPSSRLVVVAAAAPTAPTTAASLPASLLLLLLRLLGSARAVDFGVRWRLLPRCRRHACRLLLLLLPWSHRRRRHDCRCGRHRHRWRGRGWRVQRARQLAAPIGIVRSGCAEQGGPYGRGGTTSALFRPLPPGRAAPAHLDSLSCGAARCQGRSLCEELETFFIAPDLDLLARQDQEEMRGKFF